MILDSHHHLWRFDPARLPWISEAMPALRQDYGLADLEAALAGTGVDRTILVHAQQRIDETEWMLGLAAASARIAGVVGWGKTLGCIASSITVNLPEPGLIHRGAGKGGAAHTVFRAGEVHGRITPRAALLGTLAGVSVTFISMRPALEMYMTPLIGIPCFAIILVAWFGGFREGWSTPCGPRRPMKWRTVWRLTRLGRPPVI